MSIRRLLFIVLCILPVAALAQVKFFEIKSIAAPTRYSLNIDHPDCGQIVVYSSLPRLIFESNMVGIQETKYIPLESKYVIFLRPIRQKIVVKSPGFIEAELWGPGTPRPKDVVDYFSIEERQQEAGKGDFTLITDPPGAEITIDQFPVFKEFSPYTFEQFGAQSMGIALKKERYQTLNTTIVIEANKARTQSFSLQPAWADLEISSEPSGSSVYLNGVYKGVTPLFLSGASKGLDPGTYQIELRPDSDLYASYSGKVMLHEQSKETLDIVHEDISVMLAIDPSHSPLQVYLDDKINTALSNQRSERVVQGKYIMRAVYTGDYSNAFEPVEYNLELKAGQDHTQRVQFKPRTAYLDLEINIPTFDLELQHAQSGKTLRYKDQQEPILLYAGDYSLKLSNPGYRTESQDFRISDRDLALSFTLVELDKIYQLNITLWKTSKYSSGSVFLASLGATAVFGIQFLSNYNDYNKATNASKAEAYRADAVRNLGFTLSLAGVDILGASWMLYSRHKQRQWQARHLAEKEGRQ